MEAHPLDITQLSFELASEALFKYYPHHMHKKVLRLRREVNRIWPIRSYELFTNSLKVEEIGVNSNRFLVRYRVRTLTRNGQKSRDRIWKHETTISIAGTILQIENDKVLGWQDQ